MKLPEWHRRSFYVLRTYLAAHHVTYMISPCRTVYRREHNTKGRPAKWFIVNCVSNLKAAKYKAAEDFDLWLAGESEAEPCEPATFSA